MRRLLSLLILVLPLSACVVYDRNDHRHRPDYRYERYHDRDVTTAGATGTVPGRSAATTLAGAEPQVAAKRRSCSSTRSTNTAAAGDRLRPARLTRP